MTARQVRVRAHAKINLSLKVLHRRADGYHEIRTVFQTIGLHDTLEIEYEREGKSDIALEGGPEIPDNLVLRAARLFCDEYKRTGRLRFRLRKRIPMGAGLGGGSSDAAAVLLALPALMGVRAELPELTALGARLGSDVPFFLMGGTALGLGRGEELYPLPDAPGRDVLVAAPRLHVSTPEAYRALGRGLTSLADVSKLNILQLFVWSGYDPTYAENDFEEAVFRLHPELGKWRQSLEKLGAPGARLSGSGAALYGVFPDRADLDRALPRFRSDQLQATATKFVTRARYRAGWLKSLKEHVSGAIWPPRSRYAR